MRKILLLSSALFIAAISGASAADLSRPVYTKAPPPPPAPIFTWTGFYIGLNAGGKWITKSDERITVPGTVVTFDNNNNHNNDSSWIAGGQIGYNWQAPGSPWVFGIEGDIDAQDFSRTRAIGADIPPFLAGDAFSFESKWQASIRGRIGYAAWERAMLYVTGGVAFAQAKASVLLVPTSGFAGFAATDDKTAVGGTIGAGVEWAVWNNISLGVEGRYTFYGDQDFNDANPVINGVATAIANRINFNTAE